MVLKSDTRLRVVAQGAPAESSQQLSIIVLPSVAINASSQGPGQARLSIRVGHSPKLPSRPGQARWFVAKSPYANAFEDSKISRAAQVGLFGEAELRVRRCAVDASGKLGVVVHAPVWLSGCTVARSGGSGILVENGAGLRLEGTTIEASQNANLDVKDGSVDARGCSLVGGATSGLVVQGQGRAFLADSRIEGHAQGNVFAIAGARLFAAKSSIRGDASGVWLQDAMVAMVDTRIESATGAALDLRGSATPVFYRCGLIGGLSLGAGSTAQFAECELTGEQNTAVAARVELCAHASVAYAIDRTLAHVQGVEQPPSAS